MPYSTYNIFLIKKTVFYTFFNQMRPATFVFRGIIDIHTVNKKLTIFIVST